MSGLQLLTLLTLVVLMKFVNWVPAT